MDPIEMTDTELRKLREELSELESDGRTQMAQRIKTAREWGDLKENAEYHAAKEAQAHLETKILRLREQLRASVVVQPTASDRVQHGSTVAVVDLKTNAKQAFRIVSPNEADPTQGHLSTTSPVAQALVGAGVGDVVEVKIPSGVRRLRIESID